jgi:hypothetical protein
MKVLQRAAFAAMAALLVASSSMPTEAVARVVRYAPTTAFDGLWSVTIRTSFGDCNAAYRYALRIWQGQVLKAEDDPNYSVAGAVARSGAIGVTVTGGGKSANGTGRLTRNAGAGIWHTSNGECAGRWTAERRE